MLDMFGHSLGERHQSRNILCEDATDKNYQDLSFSHSSHYQTMEGIILEMYQQELTCVLCEIALDMLRLPLNSMPSTASQYISLH